MSNHQHLKPEHLYAAEIFKYSFAHYRDRIGIGRVRFDKIMPGEAKLLRRAVKENWGIARVAQALDVDTDIAARLIQSTKQATEVLEAGNPAESFRVAIHQLIERAAETGLNDDESVEALVTQICYRVSDLSCLLQNDNEDLGDYCSNLRS